MSRAALLREALHGRVPPAWDPILAVLGDQALSKLEGLCRLRGKGWMSEKAFAASVCRLLAKDQRDDAVLAQWWELLTRLRVEPAAARDHFKNPHRYVKW